MKMKSKDESLAFENKAVASSSWFCVLLVHLFPFCIKFLYHPAVILFILLNHLYSREARAGRGNGTGGKIFFSHLHHCCGGWNCPLHACHYIVITVHMTNISFTSVRFISYVSKPNKILRSQILVASLCSRTKDGGNAEVPAGLFPCFWIGSSAFVLSMTGEACRRTKAPRAEEVFTIP